MVPDIDTNIVYSIYFRKYFQIHWDLSHEPIADGKIRWLVYLINDSCCNLQYTGSTNDIRHRWADHQETAKPLNGKDKSVKYVQNNKIDRSTGLANYFSKGSYGYTNQKDHLKIVLLGYHVTKLELLQKAGHEWKSGCRRIKCKEPENSRGRMDV